MAADVRRFVIVAFWLALCVAPLGVRADDDPPQPVPPPPSVQTPARQDPVADFIERQRALTAPQAAAFNADLKAFLQTDAGQPALDRLAEEVSGFRPPLSAEQQEKLALLTRMLDAQAADNEREFQGVRAGAVVPRRGETTAAGSAAPPGWERRGLPQPRPPSPVALQPQSPRPGTARPAGVAAARLPMAAPAGPRFGADGRGQGLAGHDYNIDDRSLPDPHAPPAAPAANPLGDWLSSLRGVWNAFRTPPAAPQSAAPSSPRAAAPEIKNQDVKDLLSKNSFASVHAEERLLHDREAGLAALPDLIRSLEGPGDKRRLAETIVGIGVGRQSDLDALLAVAGRPDSPGAHAALAALALGNIPAGLRDQNADKLLTALTPYLSNEAPPAQRNLANALLQQLGPSGVRNVVERLSAPGTSPGFMSAGAQALGRLGNRMPADARPQAVAWLAKAMASDDRALRIAAAEALERVDPGPRSAASVRTLVAAGPQASGALSLFLRSQDPAVRRQALAGLGGMGASGAQEIQAALLDFSRNDVTKAMELADSLRALGESAGGAAPALRAFLAAPREHDAILGGSQERTSAELLAAGAARDRYARVDLRVSLALAALAPQDAQAALPALAGALGGEDRAARRDALAALERMGPAALPAFRDVVNWGRHDQRLAAVQDLARLARTGAAYAAPLADVLKDPRQDTDVREAAAAGLRERAGAAGVGDEERASAWRQLLDHYAAPSVTRQFGSPSSWIGLTDETLRARLAATGDPAKAAVDLWAAIQSTQRQLGDVGPETSRTSKRQLYGLQAQLDRVSAGPLGGMPGRGSDLVGRAYATVGTKDYAKAADDLRQLRREAATRLQNGPTGLPITDAQRRQLPRLLRRIDEAQAALADRVDYDFGKWAQAGSLPGLQAVTGPGSGNRVTGGTVYKITDDRAGGAGIYHQHLMLVVNYVDSSGASHSQSWPFGLFGDAAQRRNEWNNDDPSVHDHATVRELGAGEVGAAYRSLVAGQETENSDMRSGNVQYLWTGSGVHNGGWNLVFGTPFIYSQTIGRYQVGGTPRNCRDAACTLSGKLSSDLSK